MAEHRAELEAMAAGPWPPTFDDTIAALERSGVTHVIALLMGQDLDGTVQTYARDIIPAWRPAPAERTSA
jgi:peptidyl-dipeptidase Dcp